MGEERWSATTAMMADEDYDPLGLGLLGRGNGAAQQRALGAVRRGGAGERRAASGEAQVCTIEVLAPTHYLAEARAKPTDDEAP